jgi:hypothetical protein
MAKSSETKLAAAGFNPALLSTILLQYGPAALKLVEDLLAQGFSVNWIEELVQTLGVFFFPVGTMMLSAKMASARMGADALTPGSDQTANQGPVASWLLQTLSGLVSGKMSDAEKKLLSVLGEVLLERLQGK